MRVRSATRLDVGDVTWVGEIGCVEDADAAQPVMADGVRDALGAAVGAPVERFADTNRKLR